VASDAVAELETSVGPTSARRIQRCDTAAIQGSAFDGESDLMADAEGWLNKSPFGAGVVFTERDKVGQSL
jgi:hypothetical protein